MKKFFLGCAVVSLLSFVLSACGPSEPKPEEQKQQADKMKNLDERNK